MLMIILVTSLVTVIILIITSASYLISLIYDGSDDGNANDSLGLDTQQFSSTPIISPIYILNKSIDGCEDSNQLRKEGANTATLDRQNNVEDNLMKSHVAQNPQVSSKNLKEDQANSSMSSSTTSAWNTTPSVQKNLITNLVGPATSKQIFDDFDVNEIKMGGTALHWCKSKKSVDKLIKIGVPLENANKRLETALHVAARRRKLSVLVTLLCCDANLEARNEAGETPLIVACKSNDMYACQLLLTFDANLDAVDNSGFSARHHTAIICENHKSQCRLPNAAHLILAMLDSLGAKRCSKPFSPPIDETNATKRIKLCCPYGCSSTGTYNGSSYDRWQNYKKESLYKRSLFVDILENRRQQILNGDNKADGSRLLTIDGGGMRGVIVCQILIEMEKHLKNPIISYFDWVGGTSVGAFLACALSIGTSLKSLRRICFDVKDEVFSGNKPYNSKFIERVLKRTYGTTLRMSDIKERKVAVTTTIADRDPCQLRFFRSYVSPNRLLEQRGYSVDQYNNLSVNSILSRRQSSTAVAKKHTNSVNCKSCGSLESTQQGLVYPNLPVASKGAQQSSQNQTSAMKDCDSLEEEGGQQKGMSSENLFDCVIDENDHDPLIWQAVRASAAAPFFFKPFGPYLDGGIISNNPTLDMLTEFFNYDRIVKFLQTRHTKESRGHNQRKSNDRDSSHEHSIPVPQNKTLSLVVSLGTGRGKVIGKQAMIDFGQVASGFSTVFSPVELLRSIRAARDLFKKLMHQSCHTEDYILDRAQAWCSSLGIPYFRINPPLASIFSIDDKRDEQLVNALWQTKLYMHSMKEQIKELSFILDGPDSEDRNTPNLIETSLLGGKLSSEIKESDK